ncbi:MAG: fibronectin type III domain-containing protein [Planctomycetes bacterium]|nr:fibronectin type III domain-containing protein [Planctomycetota bacterium]
MTYIVIEAPSTLSSEIVSDSQINLSWLDNSYNEDGFKIERKIGPYGKYQQLALVNANVTVYSDTGLAPAMFYGYRITAYNQSGNSHYSIETGSVTHERSFERLLNKLDLHYQNGAINNYDVYQSLHTDVSLAQDFYGQGDVGSGIAKLNGVCTEITANTPEHITAQASAELYGMAQILALLTGQIRGANSTAPAPKYIPYCNTITITGITQPGFTGSYEWVVTKTGTGDVELGGNTSGNVHTPITQTSITIHGIVSSTNQDDIEIGLIITPSETTTATVITSTKITVIQVDLTFNITGTISADNDKHDPISRTVGTDLLGVVPITYTLSRNYIANQMEIMGIIKNITPTTTSQWNFRRDVESQSWQYTPADADAGRDPIPVPFGAKRFTGGPPTFNDDTNDTDEDLTPNSANRIFVWDWPRIDISGADAAPIGTVFALRFHGREWLTLCTNGDRVTRVVEWTCSITVRKDGNGVYTRVGANEIRELNPGETFPPLGFTKAEALNAMGR